jgi:dihydropteroate synthase
MGIINCTPDSFFSGSRAESTEYAFKTSLNMIRDGADILDIGGESTRPGSRPVEPEEQIRRVVPVIKEIRNYSRSIEISVDTTSAAVAEAAVNAGADIINDISALRHDPRMKRFAAESKVRIVLMHMKGTPETMQKNPFYQNAVEEIKNELEKFAENAVSSGISEEKIILDPGIGFGKRFEDNIAILKNLEQFRISSFPLLVGLSRKSFTATIIEREDKKNLSVFNKRIKYIGQAEKISDMTESFYNGEYNPEKRLYATLSAHIWSAVHGADILRVHDVPQTKGAIAMWEALS